MQLNLFFISLLVISIPFFYFNYKILKSDLKEKKIPNKYLIYLLLLLPFFYIYLFFSIDSINYLWFFWSIIFTTFVSFVLYYFWVWSAGDAKYLLVLSLFIPNIWVIPFIWNIALITLIYLIIYFLYFYIVKIWFNKIYRKSLLNNIKIDNKEKLKIFFSWSKKWKLERKTIIFKILKVIITFLTIFVIVRLSRVYIIDNLKENFSASDWNTNIIKDFIENNITYLLWTWVILTFWLYYIFRKLFSFLFKFIFKTILEKYFNINLSNKDIWFWFMLILLIILISFIIYEYTINPSEIINKLYLIFTLYLWLYIIFKILFSSYKITFQLAEQDYIHIDNLKSWEIIDKNNLIKLFWTQYCLWYENEKWLLSPNPTIYFQNIDNPIDKETVILLKKIYKTVNNYHKKVKTAFFEEKNDIKILKTFAFATYIFTWFLITFFIQDTIFKYLSNIWFEIVRNIYN